MEGEWLCSVVDARVHTKEQDGKARGTQFGGEVVLRGKLIPEADSISGTTDVGAFTVPVLRFSNPPSLSDTSFTYYAVLRVKPSKEIPGAYIHIDCTELSSKDIDILQGNDRLIRLI
jgi:hypothetical protein